MEYSFWWPIIKIAIWGIGFFIGGRIAMALLDARSLKRQACESDFPDCEALKYRFRDLLYHRKSKVQNNKCIVVPLTHKIPTKERDHMQGDKTIPLAELIDGLASVLQRNDLTEQEKTALERVIYLLNTE